MFNYVYYRLWGWKPEHDCRRRRRATAAAVRRRRTPPSDRRRIKEERPVRRNILF